MALRNYNKDFRVHGKEKLNFGKCFEELILFVWFIVWQ